MKDRIFTILISVISTFGLMKLAPESAGEHHDVLSVDRLIVRKELIVSDTGEPWEKGFEAQQIARGIYARSVTKDSVGGLWVLQDSGVFDTIGAVGQNIATVDGTPISYDSRTASASGPG